MVRRSRQPEWYAYLLNVCGQLEAMAGPNYVGFKSIELRQLLEEPGGINWPAKVPVHGIDDRIAKMMNPRAPNPRASEELRATLRALGYAPLPPTKRRSTKMYWDFLHNLVEADRLQVEGSRFRLNPASSFERMRSLGFRRARRLGPGPMPPVAFNVRQDLIPEEIAMLSAIGELLTLAGGLMAFMQGADKSKLPEARRAGRKERGWGQARFGHDAAYGILTQGFGRRPIEPVIVHDHEAYRRSIEWATHGLRQAAEALTHRTGDTYWIEVLAKGKTRPPPL